MEEDLHKEKFGSSRKIKRHFHKRERLQIKNYLKKGTPEDFIDDDFEDEEDLDNVEYKN